ncbi:hypothetical protein PMZ80_003444 [Knufia obscura]|uniref:Uncharacterized protein n=2 Tax=Knufia TaxID=430999 RepID=A0AAN8EMP4_9EURO|nr:hypothetical protein PMZ80_003444 [Knufia obscura]KAK5958638.1 hypothetical protein OHC33_000481 [Knufia fluminis]
MTNLWEIVDGALAADAVVDQVEEGDDIGARVAVIDYAYHHSNKKMSKQTSSQRQFSSIRQRKRTKRSVSFSFPDSQRAPDEDILPVDSEVEEEIDDEEADSERESDGSDNGSQQTDNSGSLNVDDFTQDARVLQGVDPNLGSDPSDDLPTAYPPVEGDDDDDADVLFANPVGSSSQRTVPPPQAAHDVLWRTAYNNAVALDFTPEDASQAADAELEKHRELQMAENPNLNSSRGRSKQLAMRKKSDALRKEEAQALRVADQHGDTDDTVGPTTPGLGAAQAGNADPLPSPTVYAPEEPEVEGKGKERVDISPYEEEQQRARGRSPDRNLKRYRDGSPIKRGGRSGRSQSNMRGRSTIRQGGARVRRRERSRVGRRRSASPSP